MSEKFFVIIDIDKIQDYVFATSKLKEIRGASAVLSNLNDPDEVEMRIKKHSGCLIYAGGGTIKAYFHQKNDAQAFVLGEVKLLKDETHTATLTGIVELVSLEDLENSFELCNVKAERKLRKHKDSQYFEKSIISNPFIKFCESCRTYPSSHRDNSDKSLLCLSCAKKRQQSDRNRIFELFRKWLEVQLKTRSMPGWHLNKIHKYNASDFMQNRDFSDIGNTSNNYIGLIVCDGNRMGQRLRRIGTSLKSYQEFSQCVHTTIMETIFESIAQYILPDNSHYVPVEFILLGGDDLVVLTPANTAVNVAQYFCKEFHQRTYNTGKEVSMCAGVAIAHTKFPISRLHSVAEGLLRSAKKLSNAIVNTSNRTEDASCIDFCVISSPSSDAIETVRKREYTCTDDNTYQLYKRPYRVYDSLTRKDELMDLVDAIKKLKEQGFPRTKLNQFYQALFSQENDQIIFDTLLLKARLNKNDKYILQEEILKRFNIGSDYPWIKTIENGEAIFKTPITDIVDLYDFIK